ncbi:MAG: DMT family transporter [Thermoplasmata archaeon]|nr:DMT family transporter [Thermoplasmata archaeon]
MKQTNTSLAAITAVALWGLAFPLIQDSLVFFSPIMLGFLRFGIASILMAVVLAYLYPLREVHALLLREWKPIALLAALYVTIPNIAQNIGLQESTSSVACVIQSSGPVLTLLFAMLLLGEKITRAKGIGTVIAIAGTVILVTNGGISLENESFVCNAIIMVSAVSYGLAWVSAKRVMERNPPMLVIGLAIIIGTVFLALALPMEADLRFDAPPVAVLDIIILGVFCAGVSSILYLTALRTEEVSRLAFFIYLMPVFASLFAWVLRGEMVEALTVACGFVIVVGIVIATREREGRPPAKV